MPCLRTGKLFISCFLVVPPRPEVHPFAFEVKHTRSSSPPSHQQKKNRDIYRYIGLQIYICHISEKTSKKCFFVSKIVLTYCEKKKRSIDREIFWNSRLNAKNLQKFWDHYYHLFKQCKERTIFETECFVPGGFSDLTC